MIKYLTLLLGVLVGSGGGFIAGRIVGHAEGSAQISASLNSQYAAWVERVKDRTVAAERERAQREIERARRSVRIIREVEKNASCTSPGMDPCLRNYLELRSRAEADDPSGD